MNRRGALVTIGLTAFGGVAWSISRPLLLGAELTDANFTPFGTESSNALDDRLSKDIAHPQPACLLRRRHPDVSSLREPSAARHPSRLRLR